MSSSPPRGRQRQSGSPDSPDKIMNILSTPKNNGRGSSAGMYECTYLPALCQDVRSRGSDGKVRHAVADIEVNFVQVRFPTTSAVFIR